MNHSCIAVPLSLVHRRDRSEPYKLGIAHLNGDKNDTVECEYRRKLTMNTSRFCQMTKEREQTKQDDVTHVFRSMTIDQSLPLVIYIS